MCDARQNIAHTVQIYFQEITGDNSKADTQKQAEYDERIRCIIKNADPALC